MNIVSEETRAEAKKLAKKLERIARPNAESKIKYGSRSRQVEAAKRYAEADKSDPFAFKRAMTHLNNGIAGFGMDGRDSFYDADEYQEGRVLVKIISGQEVHEDYNVTAYKNRVRP